MYGAIGLENKAEDCTKEADQHAFDAMDRIMRIVGEDEPSKVDDQVELVIEVVS